MHLVVPFDVKSPKTRLGGLFDADERAALARVMLDDVLAAVGSLDHETRVLATAPVDGPVPVEVDDRPLSAAVNAVLAEETPIAIVMADLPLATPSNLRRLFAPQADVILVPGRGGGTNALVSRHPEFRVDYHGASFADHRSVAAAIDASVSVVDSHRLSTDVDERADLVEVLLHGEGTRTRAWLESKGIELAVDAGRVGVRRR